MRFLLVALIMLFNSSCATQSTIPLPIDYKYKDGAKIGFMSALSPHPVHQHVGYTAFSNFEKDLDVNWGLDKFIFDRLKEKLLYNYRYELIDLSQNPKVYDFIERADTPIREGGIMTANPEFINDFDSRFKEYDLSGVIFIADYKIFHSKDFDRLELARGRQGSYGIESDKRDGKNQVSSLMGSRSYSLKNNHYIGGLGLGVYREDVGFVPVDYNNLSSQELKKYELYFKSKIELDLDILVDSLPKPTDSSCKNS